MENSFHWEFTINTFIKNAHSHHWGHSTNRNQKQTTKQKVWADISVLEGHLSTGMIESDESVVSWKILGCYLEPSLCMKGDISTFSDILYSMLKYVYMYLFRV